MYCTCVCIHIPRTLGFVRELLMNAAYDCDYFRTAKFCWSRSRAQRCLGHYVNLDCSSAVDEVSSRSSCAGVHACKTDAVSAQSPRRHPTSFFDQSTIIEYQFSYVVATFCLYWHDTFKCWQQDIDRHTGQENHKFIITVHCFTGRTWTQVNTPALTPARQAGTRYPGGQEGWVDLGDWLHTGMVYPPTDGHPYKY